MSAQFAPAASQRRHLRVKVIVGVPLHVPLVAVSVRESWAVPEIAGGAVAPGACELTAEVAALVALPLPAPLVPVTTTRKVEPTSPEPSTSVDPVAPATSEQPEPAE